MSLNYPVNYDPVFCIHLYQCMGKCKTLIVAFPARVLLIAGMWLRSPPPATRHSPAARRPSVPRLTARGLQWPSGPEAQSWFSRVFCPVVNPRSCTDPHQVWACKMEVRSSCMTPWNVLRIERLSLALIFCPRHRSPVPCTDLPSQALIFFPLHWSQSVPCTDLLSLVLIFCY